MVAQCARGCEIKGVVRRSLIGYGRLVCLGGRGIDSGFSFYDGGCVAWGRDGVEICVVLGFGGLRRCSVYIFHCQ
jgi:hypothetical protein